MYLKEIAIVKNLARLIGIESKKSDGTLKIKLDTILDKIEEKHGYRYDTDSLKNILSKNIPSGGPDDTFRFRLAHYFHIDNPEDLEVPDDFIKMKHIIDISNLPGKKKDIIKKILQIDDPGRLDDIFENVTAYYEMERREFRENIENKIHALKGRKSPPPDKKETKNNEKSNNNQLV